jgi:hypothetical protein
MGRIRKCSDTDFEFVETFRYRRRLCVIVKVVNVHTRIAPKGFVHNGYVSATLKNRGKHFGFFSNRIRTEELTYSGQLHHLPKSDIPMSIWFLGFDTLHIHNSEHPSSQSYSHVKRQTKKLADEMIRKRI